MRQMFTQGKERRLQLSSTIFGDLSRCWICMCTLEQGKGVRKVNHLRKDMPEGKVYSTEDSFCLGEMQNLTYLPSHHLR